MPWPDRRVPVRLATATASSTARRWLVVVEPQVVDLRQRDQQVEADAVGVGAHREGAQGGRGELGRIVGSEAGHVGGHGLQGASSGLDPIAGIGRLRQVRGDQRGAGRIVAPERQKGPANCLVEAGETGGGQPPEQCRPHHVVHEPMLVEPGDR